MGQCAIRNQDEGDGSISGHPPEFATGNVCRVDTKESWEEMLSDATRDGKLVESSTLRAPYAPARQSIYEDVIANFSAPWCGPCRLIAPFFCELSEKYPAMMFVAVDVDELTDFSTAWDIKATPTFFFFRDGKQVDKLVGANRPDLQTKVEALSQA